jgi:protease II
LVPSTRRDDLPADPYRWLEDEKSPEVQAWMKAQDTFARELIHALPERDALLKRYRELYYLDSMGAPTHRGGRYFYVRTHKDKEKAVVYWKQGASGEEKVLFDPNTWSTDNTVSLGATRAPQRASRARRGDRRHRRTRRVRPLTSRSRMPLSRPVRAVR